MSGCPCVSCQHCSKGMDVDEVTIDPAASWKPVDKPKDSKDEGELVIHFLVYTVSVITTVDIVSEYIRYGYLWINDFPGYRQGI